MPGPTVDFIISNGYRMILTDERWPGRNQRVYKFEHRLVMERLLGRKLARHEVVHHRDHNRLNNDPSNLELTTHLAHGRHHHHPGADPRSHVHKHYGCECGQSTGLDESWREANRAQRERDLTRDEAGRIRRR